LAPAIPEPQELGPDGAEAKGLFLPPIAYPRRMWAGGRIETFGGFSAGQRIARRSTISAIDHREGKAGAFYLVSVTHEIAADGQLVVRDRQDLVFRASGRAAGGQQAADVADPAAWTVEATAALLFRFSAFTFNGHRIHYDLDFATREEGYAGLLVHGPLQAALLLNKTATVLGAVPGLFTYRCVAPLIAGQAFRVQSTGGGASRIVDAAGITTCEGRVPETA
jgi:3-methylfumaryl-CoA hydratase